MTLTHDDVITNPVRVVSEPLTYTETGRASFFQDLRSASLLNDWAARERLNRHQREFDIETRATPNTTAGTGGEFDPPLWAIDKFSTAIRASRVLADLVPSILLPPGKSSIHIPRFTTGADAGIQAAQNIPAIDVDLVTTDLGSTQNVVTIAGNADASQQLFDQTPAPGFDGILYTELSLAYNQALEKQLLAGTGSNGQLTGVTKVSGIGSVSGAGVSTTQNTMVTNLWTLIGQAAAIVGTLRELPAEVVLMAPRRYYAIASAEDNSNRPLASPGQGPHPNDMPAAGGSLPVGPIIGIPCYLSGGIIGATGTTADYVVVMRPSDCLLYESAPKFVCVTNPESGTLSVRCQLRRYAAFFVLKPAAVSVVTSISQPTNF